VSMVGGAMSLMEGVTRRYGEGNVAPAETPEQIRTRLTVLGVLAGSAAVGWALARVAMPIDSRETNPPPPVAAARRAAVASRRDWAWGRRPRRLRLMLWIVEPWVTDEDVSDRKLRLFACACARRV
jgi:hypothetical protein